MSNKLTKIESALVENFKSTVCYANSEKFINPVTRENSADDPLRPRDLSLLLHPLAGKLRTPAQTFVDQLGELRVPRGCEDWYEKETGRKVVRLLQKSLDY